MRLDLLGIFMPTTCWAVPGCLRQISNLDRYTALRSLCVHGHALAAIEGIHNLCHLTDLNLSANRITSLAGIERLTALQFLNLSRNMLTSTSGLGQCVKLQRLVLSHNSIRTLGGLGELAPHAPCLNVVDLRANHIDAMTELQSLAG